VVEVKGNNADRAHPPACHSSTVTRGVRERHNITTLRW